MPSNVRRGGSTGVWLLLVYASIVAVTTIPYAFPPNDGISASYVFGFSNRICILLILTTIAATAWLAARQELFFISAESGPARGQWWVPAAGSLLTAAITTAYFLYFHHQKAQLEATYFLDRLRMEQLGLRPYRDFRFDYGPLQLYPALWLRRLSRLSISSAYFTTWILEWTAGAALIYTVTRRFAASQAGAALAFALGLAAWLPSVVAGGLNYTPLRFFAAATAALWLHDQVQKARSPMPSFLTAALIANVLLFYSPEQGIFLAVAVLVYYGAGIVLVRNDHEVLKALAAFLGIFIAGLFFGLKMGDR